MKKTKLLSIFGPMAKLLRHTIFSMKNGGPQEEQMFW